MGDHPRRCGAFPIRRTPLWLRLGSSPQVRGISILAEERLALAGIIPAGAGHLPVAPVSPMGVPDHPRRCGAFMCFTAIIFSPLGSSPQVRGICHACVCDYLVAGIIPAGAGHFCLVCVGDLLAGDHPRRCGAFAYPREAKQLPLGSSPQVRGISFAHVDTGFIVRIIPAGAGHFFSHA